MMLAPTQVHTPTSTKGWRSGFLGNLKLRSSSRRARTETQTIPQFNLSTQRCPKISPPSSTNSTSSFTASKLSRTHTKQISDVSAVGLLVDLNPVTGAPVQAAPAPAFPMSFDGKAARRPPFPTQASFSSKTPSVFKPVPILRKDSSPPRVNVVLEKPVMPKPPRGTLNTPQKLAYVDWRLQIIQDEQMEDDEHRELLLEPTFSIESDEQASANTPTGWNFPQSAPTPGESRSRMTSIASVAPSFLASDPHQAKRAGSVSRHNSIKVKIASRPSTADAFCGSHSEGTPGQFARNASAQLQRTGSVTHGSSPRRSDSISHSAARPGRSKRFGSFASSIKSFARPQTPDSNYSQLMIEASPRTSNASLGGFKTHSYANATGYDESLEELNDEDHRMATRESARESTRASRELSRPVSRQSNNAKRWTKIVVTAMGGFAPQLHDGSDLSDSD